MTDNGPDFDPPALVPPGWLERNPGLIPTMAVVVFETIDANGHTAFHRATSNQCQEWREIGLLRAALVHVESEWCQALDERTNDD